jgi:hypothetical protein
MCDCLSDRQKALMKEKVDSVEIAETKEQTLYLDELELGEINFICLKNCASHISILKNCVDSCENTLSKLMREGNSDNFAST